jgi:radical SAM superfamily enzyme YgiQ (UPF0313 family)
MVSSRIIANDRTVSLLVSSNNTYIFDLSGRPLVMVQDGNMYMRGMDGRVKSKTWKGSKDQFGRTIHELEGSEIRHQTNEMYRELLLVEQQFRSGASFEFQKATDTNDAVMSEPDQVFSRLLYWTPDELIANAEEFHRIYRPINILPPDQYFSVPLQIVEGCPWNRCTFCNFYRGRKFHVRTENEVVDHIRHVKEFFGASLPLRRTIFLCDANALAAPSDEFSGVLKLVNKEFPMQCTSDGGIFTFADVPTILNKKDSDLTSFAQNGLRRVYIGMESGSEQVRRLVNKLGTKDELILAVEKLKRANLGVGLIILLGVGGTEWEDEHVKESVAAFKNMKLDRRDILYFSPFYPSSFTDYQQNEKTKDLTPLAKEAIRRQYRTFLKRLHLKNTGSSPTIGVYDIREFVV